MPVMKFFRSVLLALALLYSGNCASAQNLDGLVPGKSKKEDVALLDYTKIYELRAEKIRKNELSIDPFSDFGEILVSAPFEFIEFFPYNLKLRLYQRVSESMDYNNLYQFHLVNDMLFFNTIVQKNLRGLAATYEEEEFYDSSFKELKSLFKSAVGDSFKDTVLYRSFKKYFRLNLRNVKENITRGNIFKRKESEEFVDYDDEHIESLIYPEELKKQGIDPKIVKEDERYIEYLRKYVSLKKRSFLEKMINNADDVTLGLRVSRLSFDAKKIEVMPYLEWMDIYRMDLNLKDKTVNHKIKYLIDNMAFGLQLNHDFDFENKTGSFSFVYSFSNNSVFSFNVIFNFEDNTYLAGFNYFWKF